MTDDAVLTSIDDAIRAADDAVHALSRCADAFRGAREARANGASTRAILDVLSPESGPDVRREAGEAISTYLHAVMLLRGIVIRSLVDVEGVPVTRVASRLGVSRQMVARLYAAAAPDPSS